MQSSQRRHADAVESHQLFILRWNRAFQIGVVVEVVEALDEEVVGLIDIGIQASARIQKPARDLALIGNLFLGEKVSRLSAFGIHGKRLAESPTPNE